MFLHRVFFMQKIYFQNKCKKICLCAKFGLVLGSKQNEMNKLMKFIWLNTEIALLILVVLITMILCDTTSDIRKDSPPHTSTRDSILITKYNHNK